MPTLMRDVVVLGMAVPSLLKDGRKSVCVAAYHEDHGLIRIYPCYAKMGLGRWKVFDLEVARNPNDNRHESWKLTNAEQHKDGLGIICKRQIKKIADKLAILEPLVVDCVNTVNQAKGSMCIVKPATVINTAFRANVQKKDEHDLFGFEDEWLQTKTDYPFSPVIEYTCSDTCDTNHKQTNIEWGAFEFMRKNPATANDYWKATGIYKDGYETFLIVGNQANRRNSFIVINVICIKTNRESCADNRSQLSLL